MFSVVTNSLAVEHALIMVMMLYSLLAYRNISKLWVIAIVAIGAGLSLFTPPHLLTPAWEIIHLLLLPILIWEAAVNIAGSQPKIKYVDIFAVGLVLLFVTLALTFVGGLPLSNSLLLSALAIGLIWKDRPEYHQISLIGGFGLLMANIIILESDLASVDFLSLLRDIGGALFVGVALGILFVGVAKTIFKSKYFSLFGYGVLLIGHLLGGWLELSSIALMLTTALFIIGYGNRMKLWKQDRDFPKFFDSPIVFVISSVLWLVLGWEAHVDFSVQLLWPILIALLVFFISSLMANTILNPERSTFAQLISPAINFGVIISASLFLWPPELILNTAQVEIAALVSVILIVIIRFGLPMLINAGKHKP